MQRLISTHKWIKHENFQVNLLVTKYIRIIVRIYNNRAKLNKIN